MATKKISELEEINQAENDDYLVVVDTSESKNKKITKENFLKISALEEKISDLENNQLTASTEGTSIDINDSADYQVREMIPNGNVVQNSTTGKNLFKPIPSATRRGITFTNNGDGSYTLNGTATAPTSFYIVNVGYGSGTYALSANNPVTNSGVILQLETSNGNKNTALNAINKTLIGNCDDINALAVMVSNGTTLSNFVIKPQLELGSSVTDFEPYTNGASPNPQYEQPINSSGDAKNLYYLPEAETLNGITYSINEDGTINLVGTATANVSFPIFENITQSHIEDGATYTFSSNQALPSGVEFRAEAFNNTSWLRHLIGSVLNNSNRVFTGTANLTDATRIRHLIYIASGTTVNLTNLEIQFEKGSIKTSFTPEGKGFINEVISNKNFFNMDGNPIDDFLSRAGYTLKYNDNKTITINGTGTGAYKYLRWELTLGAGTYIASGCPSGGSQNGYSFLIRVGNSSYWDYGNGVSFTLIEKTTIQVHPIRLGSTIPTFNNVTFKPMIRLASSSATSFVPHEEQNISIPCQQPMRSIGNVRDGFVKIDGVWYEKHNIGQVVLNGSESGWTYDSNDFYFRTSNYTFEHIPKTNTNDTVQLSNYFKHTSGWGTFRTSHTTNLFYSVQNSGYKLCFRNVDITTVSDWTNWLQNHNVKVIYPTEEPYYLECTEEQITALEQARTYKPVTHILSADVVPAYLEVTYVRDLETVINNLS